MRKLIPKKKMGEVDYFLFCIIALLIAIGIVMVYSASSYYSMFYNEQDSMYYLKKQAIAVGIGFAAMLFMMALDYHKIKKYTLWLLIITVPLLLLVFVFPPVKGAQRWIYLGPFSFQPSELTKYVVVLFLAMSIDLQGENIKKFGKGIVRYLVIAGFFAGLVLLEKNLSICAIIMIVTFIMLYVGGGRIKHLFGYIFPFLFALGSCFIVFEPYRLERLISFTNPWADPVGDGYQLIQSFYALGSGGALGLGLGQSRQKTLYMPEPHNDFIFSIIGEELGYIGCLFIILLFVLFVWRGIRVAMRASDNYGTLIAVGITSIIAVQAIINIAVVTGSMPVTGVPLPFISYGGTSISINMAAMGILLNISRQIQVKK